jgi:hypothetical protein
MGIEIKNAEVIVRLVKERLEKAKAKLEIAVSDEVTRIVRRTMDGKDVDGKSFAPYTPAYNRAKAKLKSGFVTRSGKSGKYAKQLKGDFSTPALPVDLTLSGNMLAAIQTKVEETSTGATATIFFNSALEALKAQGNQVRRHFFGLSDEQVERIKRKVTEP